MSKTALQCQVLRRTDVLPGKRFDVGQSYRPMSANSSADFGWLAQREEADCGVACLAMVLRHLGCDVSPESLRRQIPLSSRGCSLLALQRAAYAHARSSTAIRISATQLADVSMPAIALQTGGHFVVVVEKHDEEIVVADPALGLLRQELDQFRERWTGHLLAFL